MTTPRVAIGLDLQAPSLGKVGQHSTLEHWVWVSLQGYQPVFRRLGYQWKLWHVPGPDADRPDRDEHPARNGHDKPHGNGHANTKP